MRGPRRQGPAAGRPRRRPRRPPGRLGHPPAPGAARPGSPAPRGRRAPASSPRTGARCRGRPGTFDRVLADVPCSGLGSLRRRPEARWRKTPADVAGTRRPAARAARRGHRLGPARRRGRLRDLLPAPGGDPRRRHRRRRARDDVTILDAPAVLPEVPGLRGPEPANPESRGSPSSGRTVTAPTRSSSRYSGAGEPGSGAGRGPGPTAAGRCRCRPAAPGRSRRCNPVRCR